MRLRYTKRAATELDIALGYVAERSPRGAKNIQRRIQSAIVALLVHPKLGRLTTRAGLRRLVVASCPYLIFYTATDEEIVIHGVRHGARRPSSMPDAG